MFVADRAGREIQILEVASLSPIRSKVNLIRGLFLPFLISFLKLLFCRVLASV